MRTNLRPVFPEAISVAAVSCQQRQHLAEPLWFAVMCRVLWGPNASKDLKFILDAYDGRDRSERTCRAWTSGDSEPPCSVLGILMVSDQGRAVLDYLQREMPSLWWLALMRAERVTAQVDAMKLE